MPALAPPLPRQERWIVPIALGCPKSSIDAGAGSCSAGCRSSKSGRRRWSSPASRRAMGPPGGGSCRGPVNVSTSLDNRAKSFPRIARPPTSSSAARITILAHSVPLANQTLTTLAGVNGKPWLNSHGRGRSSRNRSRFAQSVDAKSLVPGQDANSAASLPAAANSPFMSPPRYSWRTRRLPVKESCAHDVT
jgi:hypothetical protein